MTQAEIKNLFPGDIVRVDISYSKTHRIIIQEATVISIIDYDKDGLPDMVYVSGMPTGWQHEQTFYVMPANCEFVRHGSKRGLTPEQMEKFRKVRDLFKELFVELEMQ